MDSSRIHELDWYLQARILRFYRLAPECPGAGSCRFIVDNRLSGESVNPKASAGTDEDRIKLMKHHDSIHAAVALAGRACFAMGIGEISEVTPNILAASLDRSSKRGFKEAHRSLHGLPPVEVKYAVTGIGEFATYEDVVIIRCFQCMANVLYNSSRSTSGCIPTSELESLARETSSMSCEETPSQTDSSTNVPECEGLTEGGTREQTDSVIAQQDSIRLQAEFSIAVVELADLRQRSQELDEVKAKLKRAHKQMEAVGKSKKKKNNAGFVSMRNRVDELEKDLNAAETRYNDIQSDLLYSKQREAMLSESLLESEERIRSMTLELTAERASKTNMAVANVELAIDLAEEQELIAHSTCLEQSGGSIDVNTKESSSHFGTTPWGMLPERRHSL